jgi:hypothetical protein
MTGLLREISDRLAGLERVLSGAEGHEAATLTLRVDPDAPGTPAVPGTADSEYREHLDRAQRALLARKALRSLTQVEAQALDFLAHARHALGAAHPAPGDQGFQVQL